MFHSYLDPPIRKSTWVSEHQFLTERYEFLTNSLSEVNYRWITLRVYDHNEVWLTILQLQVAKTDQFPAT